MKKALPRLATSDELRSFMSRAHTLLDEIVESQDLDFDAHRSEDNDSAYRGAKDALRFASLAAGFAGDILLLPELIAAAEEQEHWNEHGPSDIEAGAEALTRLLSASERVDEQIALLADHPVGAVRAALAKGLHPGQEGALPLLEKLALDTASEVRVPARAALAKHRELPFWAGKFQKDPLANLSPEEIARHKPTLDRISAMVDAPNYEQYKSIEELKTLVASLPDALAVDFVVTQLSRAETFDYRLIPLGSVLCACEGGAAALAELCEAWARIPNYWISGDHVEMARHAPPERRLALCLWLSRWATGQMKDPREMEKDAARFAAEIAGKAFPEGADLSPLLDMLLSFEEREEANLEGVRSKLLCAFEAEGADPTPILDRVLEARLCGYPGAWAKLRYWLDKLLERAPRAELRRAGEAAIASEDEETRTWGLRQLLLFAHDPERDGTPLATAQRFLDDAGFREAILHDDAMSGAAVAILRRELGTGKLGFFEAATALKLIGKLWGGVLAGSIFGLIKKPEEQEAKREQRRARWAEFLGPSELHGPPTAKELAMVRKARQAEIDDEEFPWMLAFETLPEGPFDPEDRALIEACVARMEGGEDLALEFLVAATLAVKADIEMLPIFDRLIALEPDCPGDIRRKRRQMREALGLSDEEPEAEDEASPEEQELLDWMDDD